MRLLLPWDSPGQTAELVFQALDLEPRGFALPPVQFRRRSARKSALSTVHDRGHHLQIA
jgi:hypothetical protein